MGMFTRRQFLTGAGVGGVTLALAALSVACGQPTPRAVPAGARATGDAGTPGTPDFPTPTRAYPLTPEGTVILPTAPPYLTATPRPTPTAGSGNPPPTREPDEPYQVKVHATRAADPAQSAYLANLVVLGTVTEVLPSRWSTPDGSRPFNPHSRDRQENGNNGRISTPVVIAVERSLKGSPQATQLYLHAFSGTVGQDFWIRVDGLDTFQVSERVVVFLTAPTAPVHEPKVFNGQTFWAICDRYTITNNVATNSYQTLPLDELLSIIAVEAPTPTVTPQIYPPTPTIPARPSPSAPGTPTRP